MPKKSDPKPELKPRITHIMADGSVRDSVEGYVVPYNNYTAVCYQMLARYGQHEKEGS
nr:hypothetical protein [uncultured Caproiciproducens sp.]